MKKETIGKIALISTALFYGFIALARIMVYVETKQNEYESKKQTHVLEMWGDGKNAGEDHECEYGAEWCNPVFAEFLENNKNK